MKNRLKKQKNRRQGKNIVAPSNNDNLDLPSKLEYPDLPIYPESIGCDIPGVAILGGPMSSSDLRTLETIFNRHGYAVILPSTN